MLRTARGRAKRITAIVVLVIIAALVTVAVINRQLIKDELSAAAFEPNARVTGIAESLQLTTTGTRVFMATHPTIDASQHFNEQCAGVDHSEQGHVLGCFAQDRIHLFDVQDERVSGVVEVTAAHELLHATFARMPEGDRAALAQRLREFYDEASTGDTALHERMEVYAHLPDAAFANELHSVLGTEVRELPDWLEAHYAQWFVDRNALIDDFDAYHAVFVDLQQQATDLEAHMTELRASIEERKATYDSDVQTFNADAEEFAARNERYEFSGNLEEFERIRADLEYRRGLLGADLENLQSDIDTYNGLRQELETLSQVSTELDEKLNSELAPVTTRPTD